MLIVVAGGPEEARRKLVRYLLDEHQFTACNRLPRGQVAGRLVVCPDQPPATRSVRLTLARRTTKLGGILISLDNVPAAEVTLPLAFEAETDHLVGLLSRGAWGVGRARSMR